MPTRRLLALLCALLAAPSLAGSPGGTVAGTWRLTEQYYNNGQFNFAAAGPTLRLSLLQDASAGVVGTLSFDKWDAVWPAWPTPDGPAPLEQSSVRSTLTGGTVEADYRVLPPAGDDTTLLVHETCALESPDRLGCQVVVRFERDGKTSGGFTWRRFFARETGQ